MEILHCFIAGRVQGVWFRGWTAQQARQLGLIGYVRNLPDGRVECLAAGEDEPIITFRELLRQGPPAAVVTELRCVEHPQAPEGDEFVILR